MKDTRVEPLPRLTVVAKAYDGVRVWRASRPVFDTSEVPERGTRGWHVHAYDKNGSGKKAIDDTYETVVVDGLRIGSFRHLMLRLRQWVAGFDFGGRR